MSKKDLIQVSGEVTRILGGGVGVKVALLPVPQAGNHRGEALPEEILDIAHLSRLGGGPKIVD